MAQESTVSNTPVLRSPRGSFFTTDSNDTELLPWKIAFRVQFQAEKLGLRFHPAQFPDTGNGIYTIRVLELNKGPNGADGPAQQYNSALQPGQEHLALRPGLYLTHINDTHLIDMPCEAVITILQKAPRPTMIRFIDVEAGVVTPHELRDSLKMGPETTVPTPSPSKTSIAPTIPSSPTTAPKTSAVGAAEPVASSNPVYKIILLGTTGVGKSSVLAVGVQGDSAYTERRATTLEAEFGSFEIPHPDISNPNKVRARIWDTAGQERYRAITRSHYRRADGALLVYDVADPESFEKLGEWLNTLRETTGDSLKSIMVIENKIDQLPEPKSASREPRPKHFVQEDVVQAFCKEQGLLFARTSAKMNATAFKWEGQKVSDAFSTLVLHIHATTLARGSATGLPSTGTNEAPTPIIELKDAPAAASEGKMLADCGSCARSQ
ncbi:hypothetical protein Poli38472_009007 [Pythium oligandrum]|uniref:Uncharacterized protein n=1 Tax=Pythium oligandrum TaxID=41045 RepID=A0A8K1CKC0_PYTOL|nr:hypothetical protein Poli38472_009007 [Pythium oligandrum]|eukprot:TMW64840.1 hypothetical protein Poli38472_009007 [Pythium oligandrum]